MPSKRARLDRFISAKVGISQKSVRPILAQGRVSVDGCIASDIQQLVDEFSHITFDARVLQDNKPHYLMLNKPAGVVSATKDEKHKTVIDLLKQPYRHQLHIVGRLDYNSTGLLLLTNDSRWSQRLMAPEKKVSKRYRVKLDKPVTQEMVTTFAEGLYFAYEDITTRPAKLTILSHYEAEVSLTEGRYHQIKRMFGHFQNEVLELHRTAIGNLKLDPQLGAGESRELTAEEVGNITNTSSDELI